METKPVLATQTAIWHTYTSGKNKPF